MILTLRDYQSQAVENVRQAYRQKHNAPLLVLSTGGGKTVIFCHITERMALLGKRVIILVHRQELLNQTSEALTAFGVEHGCISPGHSHTCHPIQVASVQTIVRRLNRIQEPDLIVIDECHHSVAGSWAKIIKHFSKSRLLGVTATPMRLDGKGLGIHSGGCFDTLVDGPAITELIEQGYLSQPLVYAPPSGVDLSGVKTRGGDYEKAETAHRMDKPTITGCAIDHYMRLCNGMPAIAFCATVEHAQHVAQQFNGAGITAESLDGTLTDAARKHRITALGRGQIKVLTSCEIISEGTDIPIVGAAILLRPTKSTGLYLQQVGRALRPIYARGHDLSTVSGRLNAIEAGGKQAAIIIDHVGNCYRHGLPDDVREWSLDGYTIKRKKSDTGPKIKQCDKCYAVYAMGKKCCPQCGNVNKIKKSEIRQVDGELGLVNEMKTKKKKLAHGSELANLVQEAKRMGLPGDLAYRMFYKQKGRKRNG